MRPAGAARTAGSAVAAVTVSAEYDWPAHGSSFQVVRTAPAGSGSSSGRSAAACPAQVAGPSLTSRSARPCSVPANACRTGWTWPVLSAAVQVQNRPGTLCTADAGAALLSGICSLALCASPLRSHAARCWPGTGGTIGSRRSTAIGTAMTAASPVTVPVAVLRCTPCWSCCTARTGLASRTAEPSRRARPVATCWLPPATRQLGRPPNPAVASSATAAESWSALIPEVVSIRAMYAARAAGSPAQPAATSAREVPGAAAAAASATQAAHSPTCAAVAGPPPRGSRS